ncbi:DUF2335 domain-containing protein [Pseudomonas coronafaciens]|uniref:DUF2335 domain-containing protein n=1 Tax=Pseudomonas coronafaciens TaxID=53409 RepID=UPI000EFF8221|nr:DUF2335 domain-containing protein [Pseudomonas coronafaciens]
MQPDVRNIISDDASFDSDEARAHVVTEAREEELRSEAESAVESIIDSENDDFRELLEQPAHREAMTRVVTQAVMQLEQHRGPLPSPRHLHEYEQCLVGAAERIVSMAEKEQNHRHCTVDGFGAFRDQTLNHVRERDARGQYLGAGVCGGVILLCFFMVNAGEAVAAAGLATATLVGLAAVFVTRRNHSERSEGSEPED